MTFTWIKMTIRTTYAWTTFTSLAHNISTHLTTVTSWITTIHITSCITTINITSCFTTSARIRSASYTTLAIYKMTVRTTFARIIFTLRATNTFSHMTHRTT